MKAQLLVVADHPVQLAHVPIVWRCMDKRDNCRHRKDGRCTRKTYANRQPTQLPCPCYSMIPVELKKVKK